MTFKAMTPMLETRDFPATLQFYTKVLQFVIEAYHEHEWLCLSKDGVALMFRAVNPHHDFGKPVCSGSFYFLTDNVDTVWSELQDKATVCYPLEEFEHGMREFAIYDPNGYVLQFGQEFEKGV